jgi:hypothetical protein
MTGMSKWPVSGWTQAGIAFLAALVSTIVVFIVVNNVLFARYAREFPHDGQDGLGAMMGALEASFATLIGVFVIAFAAQRVFTSRLRQ